MRTWRAWRVWRTCCRNIRAWSFLTFVTVFLVCCQNPIAIAESLLGATLGNLTSPVDTRFLLDHHLYDVTWGNGQFVAVGSTGVDETEVLLSQDGKAWERVSLGKPRRPLGASETDVGALYGLAWNGLQFVAVGERIITSPDGKSWNVTTTFTPCVFSRVVAHYGKFVAVGGSRDHGCIATSTDGKSWTDRTGSIERNIAILTDVVRTEEAFVAVGSANQGRLGISSDFLSSADGERWTHHAGPNDFLVDLAWSGTSLIAVGGLASQGAVFTSSDAKDWTESHSNLKKPLRSVIWTGSRFVAVGVEGGVAISPNGLTWSEQRSGVFQDLLSVTWNGSLLVAVGNGVILTSVDGIRWQEPGVKEGAPASNTKERRKNNN
jgi:hypothetical protein